MQRFYLPPENFSGDYAFMTDRQIISQLKKVLRAQEGEKFFIFDGSGDEYLSQLVAVEPRRAKFFTA